MPAAEDVGFVVHQWVLKAENDLLTIENNLKSPEGCPTDTTCFHAQQCAEKYLKALLVHAGLDFPPTHDMRTLVTLLPEALRPELTDDEGRRLTRYATVTRYPGDYEPIPIEEARVAADLARRVRAAVRSKLPPEALRTAR